MRFEDQQLLRAYCKLGLAIAAAKNPGTKHEVSEADTLKRGYLMLKARMEQLSPKKKAAFRAMLTNEIRGVQELMAKAKASGEPFTLADIEIDMFDAGTGQRVPDRPNVQPAEEQSNDEPSSDTTDQATPQAQDDHAGERDRGHHEAAQAGERDP